MIQEIILKNLVEKPITGEWGGEGNTVSVIRTTNFTNEGVLNLKNVVQRDIAEKKVEAKKLQKGDIIIEKSGGSPTQPVGRVVYFDEEGIYLCNNFTSILRPKEEIVFPKYMHYQLFANHKFGVTNLFQNKTTGIINLQLPRYINKIKIPVPPLEEQKRIATILDKADALRQKNRKILDEYDQLAQSVFMEMFGDPFGLKNQNGLTINDVSDRITYGFTKPMPHIEIGIPIITAKNVLFDKVDFKNVHYTDDISFESLTSKCKPNEGDILIVKDGVSLGRPALVETDKTFCISQAVTLLIPRKKIIHPRFLLGYLLSIPVQNKIKGMAKGNAMPHLQITEFARFPVPSVEYSKQEEYVIIINNIRKQKKQAQHALQESEDLFQSLLQKAFKGELIKELVQ